MLLGRTGRGSGDDDFRAHSLAADIMSWQQRHACCRGVCPTDGLNSAANQGTGRTLPFPPCLRRVRANLVLKVCVFSTHELQLLGPATELNLFCFSVLLLHEQQGVHLKIAIGQYIMLSERRKVHRRWNPRFIFYVYRGVFSTAGLDAVLTMRGVQLTHAHVYWKRRENVG